MLRYSTRINSLDSLILTKLDVLGGFDQIKVCRAYEHETQILTEFPADIGVLEKCKPIYDTFKGWKDFTKEEYSSFSNEIPDAVESYLNYISEQCGVPISLISYGPERSETLDLRKNG